MKMHDVFNFSELGKTKEISEGLNVRIVGIKYYCEGFDDAKTQLSFSKSVKGVDLDERD